jgi:hypothetical protein
VSSRSGALSPPAKARLASRIVVSFLLVRVRLRREPLPALVARLARRPRVAKRGYAPERLSRAVDRTLRVGSRQPTCLVSSLVLFRLLREQGDDAELVVGLPADTVMEAAHAWVELDGRDVGPPPGRGVHTPLARFGRS